MNIKTLAILLTLGQTGGLKVQQNGATVTPTSRSADTVNCSGNGVRCTFSSGKWQLFIDGGSGSAPPSLTCSAGQYLFATDAGGTPYCATPTGVPGTPIGSVQFNDGGYFGGAYKVFIGNGSNLEMDGETASPTASTISDRTIISQWIATGGTPPHNVTVSNALGTALPEGVLSQFTWLGTEGMWKSTCCIPQGFANAAVDEIGPVGGGACTFGQHDTSPSWAATNIYTRSPVILTTTTSAGNVWGTTFYNFLHFWRGNATGAGGFLWSARIYFVSVNSTSGTHRLFAGLINRASILAASQATTSYPDTIYFGADNWQNTIRICRNDDTHYAICTDLGSTFPIANGAAYDLYLWAKPNDTHVYYAILRLDAAGSAQGDITDQLPRNTVQLTWHVGLATGGSIQQDGGGIGGTSDGGIQSMANMGTCTAWRY